MAEPLVSVITIFLDEERFLGEAVESVLAQTYAHWELLLCDDGSSDASTGIARGYAERYPERIRYLEHPAHENRGMSATRNLGLRHARGELLALLDADDVWLPGKLELQVAAMEAHPEVAMVHGPTLFWHSWTGQAEDRTRDALTRLAARPGRVARGTRVLSRVLRDRADSLCTCALLLRKDRVVEVGGFEDEFTGLFEDQAFLSKLLTAHDTFVVGESTDRYRQHPDSCCATAGRYGDSVIAARRAYLEWLCDFLDGRRVPAGLRWTARRELALHRVPALVRARERARDRARELGGGAISLSYTLGRRVLPAAVREWLWRTIFVRGSRSA